MFSFSAYLKVVSYEILDYTALCSVVINRIHFYDFLSLIYRRVELLFLTLHKIYSDKIYPDVSVRVKVMVMIMVRVRVMVMVRIRVRVRVRVMVLVMVRVMVMVRVRVRVIVRLRVSFRVRAEWATEE